MEVGVDADGDRAGVSGLRRVCEAGIFVGQEAPARARAWGAAAVGVTFDTLIELIRAGMAELADAADSKLSTTHPLDRLNM